MITNVSYSYQATTSFAYTRDHPPRLERVSQWGSEKILEELQLFRIA